MGSRREDRLGHADHRNTELGMCVRAKAGPGQAKVEVITRAGSVFFCSHHHKMHRNAILAAGYQVGAGLSLDL